VRSPEEWFTGAVNIDGVRSPEEHSAIGCAHVRFMPGARTRWHIYPKVKRCT
jgi:quercetin dioxygenase-like cupin family protein